MAPSPPTLLLAASLAAALGCADGPASDAEGGGQCPGELAPFAGELIEWYGFGHDFSEFCSAGYEISEDHARWVAQAWGTEPASFDYGLFESSDDPCWPCAQSALACVKAGLASTRAPHRHEIVHAVRPGFCFPLIEEGYAMLYGDHFDGGETNGDIRLALAETSGTLPGIHYPVAARFVAFLLEMAGVDKLRELCDLDPDDAGQFEAAISQIYGVSFEDLATNFDTYPEWTLSELRQDQACESDDVIVGPTAWDFHFGCGEPGIEGKLGVAFETQRLVELPQESSYQFIFEAATDHQLRVELRNCERDGMASVYFEHEYKHVVPGLPEVMAIVDPLPAGVYVLRVRVVDPTAPVDLHMSVETWP